MSILFEYLIIAATIITELFIVYIYADYLFEEKFEHGKTLTAYIIGYLLIYIVYIFVKNVAVNCALHFIINFTIFGLVYYCGLAAALFNSAVLTAFMVLSEVASSAILNTSSGIIDAYTYSSISLVSLCVLSKLLYMIFCVIGAKAFEPHKSALGGAAGQLKLSIMPLASVCTAVTVFYVYTYIDAPYELQVAATVCMLLLLFANIYTVYVYNRYEKISRENLSMRLAMQKDEYDAEYYKMLEEQYERQRILIHDVKNHMQIINGLATEGNIAEIRKYITEWGYDKALQKQVRYCRNSILNIIVSETAKECAESGIEFHCDIRDKSVDFISDTDISALFGNLLSNAYEAAKDSEEKLIEFDIKIKPDQNTTIVKISNSCKEPPQRDEKGLFISRKGDKEKHGLGQKSIKRIIEKYGGTFETYYDEAETRFETVIVFSERE